MTPEGCEYPGCGQPAAGERRSIGQSTPIDVKLCIEHLATVDTRDWTATTHDFWRWFHTRAHALHGGL
jgi:hypothetical protein